MSHTLGFEALLHLAEALVSQFGLRIRTKNCQQSGGFYYSNESKSSSKVISLFLLEENEA